LADISAMAASRETIADRYSTPMDQALLLEGKRPERQGKRFEGEGKRFK